MERQIEKWPLIKGYCKSHVTEVAYKTWISRIEPIKIDLVSYTAELLVPNDFHRQTISRCYMVLLKDAFYEVFSTNIEVILKILLILFFSYLLLLSFIHLKFNF